jgi:hypothetical protein
MSCSDAINLVDEPDLLDTSPFGERADLASSDYVHRLYPAIMFSAAYGLEPQARGDALLDEAMIVFQDIFHLGRLPAAAQLPGRPAVLVPK